MINGGIKFYEPSLCLFKNGATAVASSNNSVAGAILDYDKDNGWVSSGSAENTEEYIIVTLPSPQTFSRLFLLNHNFANYTVEYGSNQQFTNVKTIQPTGYEIGYYTDESGDYYTDESGNNYSDGATTVDISAYSIGQVSYSKSASYYEFDEVTTDTIIIKCSNVQNSSVLVEKYLASLIVTNEIGGFSIDGLAKANANLTANNTIQKNINKKFVVQRGSDTFECSLNSEYLYEQSDVDLYTQLYDRNEDFLIWLCGGRHGAPYFRFDAKPYRLVDLFRVRNTASLDNNYYKGLFNSGLQSELRLVEVEG